MRLYFWSYLVIGFLLGCSPTSNQPQARTEIQISAVDTANWNDRDSTLRVERLELSHSLRSLVVVYSARDGVPGIKTGDTVSYNVPGSGVVHTSRRVPVPWVETHLFQTDSAGEYREILVARNCDLHRVATHQRPRQVFGCWMPEVVLPVPLRVYVAATISDSAGLEAAYNSTLVLMNHEAFGDRMNPVPTWSEPIKRLR